MKLKKILNKRHLKEFLLINLGVLLMAGAYAILLDPNKVVVGGVAGLSTIISDYFPRFSSSFFILILNIILLIFALIFVNKEFFFKTIYASIIFPAFTFLWELAYTYVLKDYLIDLTNVSIVGVDTKVITAGAYLVIIVFGGVISGFGLGLAIRNGSSTGGVDILQRIFLKHFKIPFSVSLVIIDGSIVLSAAILSKDIYTLLYGAMFIFISGYVMDAIIFSGFNSRCVNIVTSKPNEIKDKIFEVLERGVTIVKAKGGYTQTDKPILVCVMSNSEFYRMKELIHQIDEKAFIYITRASEVHGEGFTRELTPEE